MSAMANRKFKIILIKPGHYDADGYVIQWWRSTMPSNSLASIYALLAECSEGRVLGPDVDIEIEASDECNTVVDVKGTIRRVRAAGAGFVGLIGVQSNQYPRALDLARRSARPACRWRSAASMCAAASRCCPSCRPIFRPGSISASRCSPVKAKAAWAICCATLRRARRSRSTISSTTCRVSKRPPSRSCRSPVTSARRALHQLRCRPRLPVSVLVLHHHQRAGPQIALPRRRRHREASCARTSHRASSASSSPTTISRATRTGSRSSTG